MFLKLMQKAVFALFPHHTRHNSKVRNSTISIPITNYRLNLGTWQGIYLCEFRNHGGCRKLVATVYS